MPEPFAPLLPVSVVAASPLGLLVLLAIVGVVLLVLLRRGLVPGPRAPRPRHIVVRIVCGVLGVGILVAVAAGTWSVVRDSYGGEAAGKGLTIRVPTQPPPALPVPDEPSTTVEVKKARFLVDLVVADLSTGEPVPIFVDQQELDWPRLNSLGRRIEVVDCKVYYELRVHGAVVWTRGRGVPSRLGAAIRLRGRARHFRA